MTSPEPAVPIGDVPLPARDADASARRFLLVFAALSSFMGASGMAQVTASLYAVHLEASEAMLGLIAGSRSVGVLMMALPVGLLVDRFGPARLFTIGSLLLVLAVIFGALCWRFAPHPVER